MKDRPSIGRTVMFNAFPRTKFCKDHIVNGATCKVLANRQNTIRVLFRGQTVTDLVAPEYISDVLDEKSIRSAHDV